jgi:hypothetical protein
MVSKPLNFVGLVERVAGAIEDFDQRTAGFYSDDLASVALTALAAPENREALVAWLVDADVLVQPNIGGRVLVASWATDGEVGHARFEAADRAETYVPLYRRAVETDRG